MFFNFDKTRLNFIYVILILLVNQSFGFKTEAFGNSKEFESTPKSHNRAFLCSDLTEFDKGLISDKFRALPPLQMSGSHQYTTSELKKIIQKKIPIQNKSSIILVDLREEPHWMKGPNSTVSIQTATTNIYMGLTAHDILKQEKKFSKNHRSYQTEEKLAKRLKVGYYRIPVTDTYRPKDIEVENFISFINKIKGKDKWLHFHCIAGLNRTTTFMIMYEILKTVPKTDVPFEAIVSKHLQIAGANFITEKFFLSNKSNINFLKDFYEYARERYDQKISWKEWRLKRNIADYHQEPFMGSWWKLMNIKTNLRFVTMMSYMKTCQFYRNYFSGGI